MKDVYVIILVATATLFSLNTADDSIEVGAPEGKLISTFQIVRFPNEACTGSSATRNGTCYTSAECADKGGASSGSCADGFGVCCIFVINSCGQSSSENITYWDAPGTIPSGECNLYIRPATDNICQLRLDFLAHVITGPSTSLSSEILLTASGLPGGTGPGAATAGASPVGTGANHQASWGTNCLVDSFSVSSPNPANRPPLICGTNTGYHMYVDMESDHVNVLSFLFQEVLGPTDVIANNFRGVSAFGARDWDITILQYDCGYINLAPPGCTQYFWSDTGKQVGGWLTSYNWAISGTKHLANQNQKMCIRREKSICWAAFYLNTVSGSFQAGGFATLGTTLGVNTFGHPGQACGYSGELGTYTGDGDSMLSYDCIIMPGLFAVTIDLAGTIIKAATAATVQTNPRTAATFHAPAIPQLNGGGFFNNADKVDGTYPIIGATGDAATFFTQYAPFTMIFKSDGFEGIGTDGELGQPTGTSATTPNDNAQVGIKMSYDLIPCSA